MPSRGIDRDRPHVRTHQPGDERHRQQRRDHGEGGEDGRTADLVHGAAGSASPSARRRAAMWRWMFSTTTIASSTRMPIAKISANSDTRLMREAPCPRGEQRQRQREHDGGADHDGLAPAQREQHQQHHRGGGEDQLLDQLLRLVGGGLAVVARDRRRARRRGSACRAAAPAAQMAAVTSTALLPGFLAMASVTAGAVPATSTPLRRARGAMPNDVLLGLVGAVGDLAPRPAGRPAGRRGRRPPAARHRRASARNVAGLHGSTLRRRSRARRRAAPRWRPAARRAARDRQPVGRRDAADRA